MVSSKCSAKASSGQAERESKDAGMLRRGTDLLGCNAMRTATALPAALVLRLCTVSDCS